MSIVHMVNQLIINIDSSKFYILMQENVKISSNDIRYSIGLVIVCLLILILLWLPGLLKGERK